MQDVPLVELGRYTSAVQGVAPEAVVAAAARYLNPGAASVVVVGDAKAFLPQLRQVYPKAEVIPAAGVDLDNVALSRAP
jgi:zinc protease